MRPDLNWISESFAETLSSRLATPTRYALGREERNAALAQLGIPLGTPLTLASTYKVAETLGVDWAVFGTFDVEGQRLTTYARLLDMRRMKMMPAIQVTGELTELLNLQTRLAWRLLAAFDPGFTVEKEEDFRRQFRDVRLEAFENFIRGVLAADDDSRVRFLVEADRLDPEDHRAAFELGQYYFDRKDYANSAIWFRKVVEADSDYQEALFRLAVDEFFLGHDAPASKAFEALAKQLPLNEVWNNLGVMKVRRSRYAEALADIDRAYQGDPTDPDFNFNRAVCLWHLGKYAEAAKVLGENLRASDEDVEVHGLRAMVYEKLGDSARRDRELEWLADHEVDSQTNFTEDFAPQARLRKNYDGRAFRLLSLAVHGSLEESMAVETPARHSEVHLDRGKLLLAEGRLPEAERELAEATSLIPEASEAHLALAQVYEAEGRHREAAAELETSLKYRNSLTAHLWLARVYLSLDQPEAARPHGQAALELDPGNRDAERIIDQIRARGSASGKNP